MCPPPHGPPPPFPRPHATASKQYFCQLCGRGFAAWQLTRCMVTHRSGWVSRSTSHIPPPRPRAPNPPPHTPFLHPHPHLAIHPSHTHTTPLTQSPQHSHIHSHHHPSPRASPTHAHHALVQLELSFPDNVHTLCHHAPDNAQTHL